jgi:hypothetical protein
VCVRNFNIAGLAWSNFEPSTGIDIKRSCAVFSFFATIDVVNMGDGVDVTVVMLKRKGGVRSTPPEVLC